MAGLGQVSTTTDCCSTEAQATCCEPGDKATCCGESAVGGSCGCAAGRSTEEPEDMREAVRAGYAAAATSVAARRGAKAGPAQPLRPPNAPSAAFDRPQRITPRDSFVGSETSRESGSKSASLS
jgi:hypothetical protein